MRQATTPRAIVFSLLGLFVVVSALGLYYHELFLDEAQHFLIGRDSDSLSSLYYNMRYDGHPRLWNACLYFITHYITASYAGMQVFHLLLTTAAVYVFLRWAPFTGLTKLLVILGYYFLFEYNLLSRNYAPGILLLFIACVLLRAPEKNLLWIGAVILLMCNVHLFFTFASIGIFLSLLPDYYSSGKWKSVRFAVFTFLVAVGVIAAIIQFQTPVEDNSLQFRPADWLSGQSWTFAVYGLVRGWLPIPQVSGGHFWNSYWLNENHIGPFTWGVLFTLLLAFPGLVLRDNRRALLFYYSSLFPLLFFLVVTRFTASRYFGMFFVYFVVAAWMKGYGSANVFAREEMPGSPRVQVLLRASIYSVLLLHAVIGVYAWSQDIRHPFSQSKNAAGYLVQHHLADQPIAVDGYIAGPMLCAYLQKKLYYLDIDQVGSYCTWKKSWFPVPRRTIQDEMAGSSPLRTWRNFILVSNRRLDTDSIPDRSGGNYFRLRYLADFENGIIGWESYFIYKVEKK